MRSHHTGGTSGWRKVFKRADERLGRLMILFWRYKRCPKVEGLGGRTHPAKFIRPPRSEQGAAKLVHESARNLGPYYIGENLEPHRVDPVVDPTICILPDPRTDTFRNIHDTLQIALYECKYAIVQNGEWVVYLIKARSRCKRCIERGCSRREGRERYMGCPCSVRYSGILADWEWCLWDGGGVQGVERARKDGLQAVDWFSHFAERRCSAMCKYLFDEFTQDVAPKHVFCVPPKLKRIISP